MDLSKYKWKSRILVLNTTCYQDKEYIRSRDLYYKQINDFKINKIDIRAGNPNIYEKMLKKLNKF